ncbi:hypothetical protein P409_18380 [Inquilinus limosus MP06]|uniref:Uncharacterized protein n=2 Tax=Inquilinus limosus TaxID=171674 RepID=A0A0A0D576_9PROT|nr:hypothetical protein P409_18380 [Inquilinus limosus MP06]
MRTTVVLAAAAMLVVTACGPRYSGGPGDRPETAIVIAASGEIDGVKAEYDYIRERLPGWQPAGQSLVNTGERLYDRLELVNAAGARKVVYSDISGWVGKGLGLP